MTHHRSAEHSYDDPELSAVDFLLCVMRDTTLSLSVRADAAAKLLPLYQKTQTIHITITGGFPNLTPDEVAARVTNSGDDFAWDLKPSQRSHVKAVH